MDINKLKTLNYKITNGSDLQGAILIKDGQINSLGDAYKKGSIEEETFLKLAGDVTFNISNNIIYFNYYANDLYIGEDSFDFIVKLENGMTYIQTIDILIEQKIVPINSKERFIEIYFDDEQEDRVNVNISSNVDQSIELPTTVVYSSTDKEFNIDKCVETNDAINNFSVIPYPLYDCKVEIVTKVKNYMVNNGASIKVINNANISFIKNKKFLGDEYGKIIFKNFVNKEYNIDSPTREIVYIVWHARTIATEYNTKDDIVVNQRPDISTPDFKLPIIDYPQAPKCESILEKEECIFGDLFSNTKVHKEIDNKGNKSIKLGRNVPNGAVNLAYYYNTTASLDDTVSVIETNTNNVTLHFVDDWIHKRNLATKNEDYFPETIEFDGEKGTELEGYRGILYRDFVMWEESTITDFKPEHKVQHEEFKGLLAKRVPIDKIYNDGDKYGVLNLTNSIFEAVNFVETDNELIGYNPKTYNAYTRYEGLVRKLKVLYNGSAKYSGVVNKKDEISNLYPEQAREIIMYPDESGLLHKINGEYLVDDDLFYITNKFKDNVPLYYKYKLKYKIYDNVGLDINGIYDSENISLVSGNNYPIDENKFKYKVFIEKTKYENIYDAYIYTSFIPTIENPIYVMYDGLSEEAYRKDSVNPLEIKVGILEKISPVQCCDLESYKVNRLQGITNKSSIEVFEYEILEDKRAKIQIEYIIIADGLEITPITKEIINKKYALYSELDSFKNEDMIISEKDTNGYMTARDIFMKYSSDEDRDKINENSTFRVKYNIQNLETMYSKDKTLIYTASDGNGFIYGRTYEDTGFPEQNSSIIGNNKNTRTLDKDSIYKSANGKVYKGYSVVCRNINQIIVGTPLEKEPLKGWFPTIKYAYFSKKYERIDKTIELIYSIPEYDLQIFGKYGKPYIDISGEKGSFVGNNTIKVKNTPMYIKVDNSWKPTNLSVYKILSDKNKKELEIKGFNFKYGFIEINDSISDNDKILVDYSYEEKNLHYRGYYKNQDKNSKIIDLNLNPNMYSFYTDTSNEINEMRNSYDLFNRTIHFFLKPMRIIDRGTGDILKDNYFCVYHKFDNQEALEPFDLHIGRIFVRHHTSLKSTNLIDTRLRGGGIIKEMEDRLRRDLEPESDYYLDIGTLDGKPYQENSVIIIRIDSKLLYKNGGRFSEEDIKKAVQKWAAYGSYPIIEFVDVIGDEELPQTSIEVYKNIDNQKHIRPSIWIENVNYNV
ncbi:TPA: hypothetical protein ACG3I4_000279 [Clostridioides difficile]|nr:virion structural protein [Clostridioides difficile]MDV9594593.1 virion structural protein [Clostridioides difficile]HBF0841583.1 virion structural protein [Clostridioides difficile]HBF0845250.1 virion structural protein [Clostridioides difficile]